MGDYFKYYRLIYSFIALITLAGVLWWQFSISSYYFTISPIIQYLIALPCGLVSVILMAVCIRKYFYRLSGVEAFYQHPDRPVLVTGGIHRFVRHPLYIATLLFIWSLFLIFPSLANLIACVLITLYVRIGITVEEKKLATIFGREYEEYQKTTPMLIPAIAGRKRRQLF